MDWRKNESQPESAVWNQACRQVWGWESTVIFLKLALTKACFCDYLQKDYHFEYTECDSSGSRWRVAIPNAAVDCSGLPDPVRGKECSMFWIFDPLFSWLNRNPFIVIQEVNYNEYKRSLKKWTRGIDVLQDKSILSQYSMPLCLRSLMRETQAILKEVILIYLLKESGVLSYLKL